MNPTPIDERTGKFWPLLNQIIDPEVNMGIVDLGLVYNINVDQNGLAHVRMSLTSPSCPVGPVIVQQVQDKMLMQDEVSDCEVELCWEPMWTSEMIDPEIRDLMGM